MWSGPLTAIARNSARPSPVTSTTFGVSKLKGNVNSVVARIGAAKEPLPSASAMSTRPLTTR
jgi:hypothetical protein